LVVEQLKQELQVDQVDQVEVEEAEVLHMEQTIMVLEEVVVVVLEK
jgi:hypothetical protein